MSAAQFIALNRLKDRRTETGLTPLNIAKISETKRQRLGTSDVLTIERYKQLENLPRHEPTYAEARDLASILLLPTIAALITPGDVYDLVPVIGPLQDTDLMYWRMSENVPLSVACRITIALGLDDPLELEHMPIHSQIWDTISRNERLAAPGECPWCRGVSGEHLPTCIPAGLWAPRSTSPYLTKEFPRPARPNTRGNSRLALGLKACRVRKGIKAKKLAEDLGRHPNTISRIEQQDIPLTQDLAEKIAVLLGVTVEALYS